MPDLPFATQHPQHPFAGAVIQFRVVGERFGHVEDVGAFGCGQECLGAEFLVEAEDVVDGDAEEGVGGVDGGDGGDVRGGEVQGLGEAEDGGDEIVWWEKGLGGGNSL